MTTETAMALYLREVLGLNQVLLPKQEANTISVNNVALVFLVPKELSKAEEQLLKKMALACPLQPVKVLKVDPDLGRNEMEKQVKNLAPQKVLIFGEKLFHAIKGSNDNFFDYINQCFAFANTQTYASHELHDMCVGSNVNVLKKQVWQQMKQLSQA
ncbi:MAG: hypothetical protein H6625_00215 [Bdellovibrionaceae bacterium]|nr:hypothetical protein [Pseudobdellovibrionaceae bacterium]